MSKVFHIERAWRFIDAPVTFSRSLFRLCFFVFLFCHSISGTIFVRPQRMERQEIWRILQVLVKTTDRGYEEVERIEWRREEGWKQRQMWQVSNGLPVCIGIVNNLLTIFLPLPPAPSLLFPKHYHFFHWLVVEMTNNQQ